MTLYKTNKISLCNINLWHKGVEMTTKETEIKFLPWLYYRKHILDKSYTTNACVHRHNFLTENLSAEDC